MPGVIEEIGRVFKDELAAADLGTLKGAFAKFISGTPEEKAAATAIAENALAALAAYMDGEIGRADLKFVLRNAEKGYRALADAKALRVKKAALRLFYRTMTTWLMSKI